MALEILALVRLESHGGFRLESHGVMGWLRLVGSSKLWVSLAEYSLFCRALLQKRHIILRSLLIVATPYMALEILCAHESYM